MSNTLNLKQINILLLGETGVGKSTFINAFANYITYKTLNEAKIGQLISIIGTSFDLLDDDFNTITVKAYKDSNESSVVGQSATQKSKSYIFSFGNGYLVQIIDTPGIGDTRGLDQDKQNFESILQLINMCKNLHAVCILLKANHSRITPSFSYCFKQLLCQLHQSVHKNIVFVFTHAKSVNFNPGGTVNLLKKLLDDVKQNPHHVEIKIIRNITYCLENEAFNYLLARNFKHNFPDNDYAKSWKMSSDECVRLLQHIGTLTPHAVRDTVNINTTRLLLEKLVNPIFEITQLIEDNLALQEKHKRDVEMCNSKIYKLRDLMYTPSLEQDKDLHNDITTEEKAKEDIKLLAKHLKDRFESFEAEREVIIKSMAKFYYYIQYNALVPHEDNFKDKLTQKIDHLKNQKESKKMNNEILKTLKMYEEEKNKLDKAIKSNSILTVSTTDIYRIREDLADLKLNGDHIKRIFADQERLLDHDGFKEGNGIKCNSFFNKYLGWGSKSKITKPEATDFNSFNDIFGLITYKNPQNESKSDTVFLFPIEQNGKFSSNFYEYSTIAFGSFGIVSKAKNKNENKMCAIKRIALNDKNRDLVFKEFKIMSQLNCDFVVKVNTVWIEDNYLLIDGFEKFENSGIKSSSGHRLFNPKNDLLLHIEMELCFKSLKEIIEIIHMELNSSDDEVHYHLLTELLIEIFESVNYLHKRNPPIIHRDIKPANILISHGINGRFVKLCDFGLSKLHEFEEQSHTKYVGSLKYMAPEVFRAKKYNTIADVYSIGVVIQELIKGFKEHIDSEYDKTYFGKYKNLSTLMVQMMKNQKLRPTCESILNQKSLWALSINDIKSNNKLNEMGNKSFSIEENFCLFFMKKKLEISKH